MTTAEVANKLVELCRRGDYYGAQETLFADDAVNIEPAYTRSPDTHGKVAIQEKGKQFSSELDIKGGSVSDPVVSGNYFTVKISIEATNKKTHEPQNMDEICVYEVKDGKVVKEVFYY